MDAFMKKFERLAALARASSAPRPLDRPALLARIRGLEREDDTVLSMPFRFFAEGAAAAAAVALVVGFFALSVWNDMNSPIEAIDQMFSMMDML